MAIVQNMWPNGVRTLDDMTRFGKLIVGVIFVVLVFVAVVEAGFAAAAGDGCWSH